jgi:hypothetical protein
MTDDRGEYIVEFKHTNDSILGEYLCSATNIIGTETLTFTIDKLIGKAVYHHILVLPAAII